MTRSFSVPVNVKTRSLKRINSGGLIRVISATPRPEAVDPASANDAPAEDIGKINDAGKLELRSSCTC